MVLETVIQDKRVRGFRCGRLATAVLGLVGLGLVGWIQPAAGFTAAGSLRVVAAAEGGVMVEWSREAGPPHLLGWHVERRMPDGQVVRVTDAPVEAGLFDAPGEIYRVGDAGSRARAGDGVTYRLVVVDPELQERPLDFVETVVVAPAAAATPAPSAGAKPDRAPAAPVRRVLPAVAGDRLKITVASNGLYRISAAQIGAGLTGFDETLARQAIAQTNLALTCGGTSVAWRAEAGGDALLFFGQAYRDLYTDRNVYFLEPRRGTTMTGYDRNTAQVANDPWFWDTMRAESNLAFFAYIPGTVEDDYFMWAGRQLTYAATLRTNWTWTTNVALLDPHPGVTQGQVTAYLSSGYDGPPALDNSTRLFSGNQLLDSRQWAGDARLAQTGLATNLGVSSVSVKLEVWHETNIITTTVLIDALEVRYGRRMRAQNDQLLFRHEPGTNVLTVRGFSNSNIWALDIDNPLRPRKVEVTIAEESPGNWRASWWTTSDTNRSYFVAAVPAEPERLEGVKIPVWSNALAGAPHVVIAPPAMSNAAAALVAHRQQQGLNSLLVPVEELYDAFASGRRDPRAIQRFLTLARTNWAVPPAYACLAGDGHVDYFDFFGQAGTRPNHIPPLLDRIPYQTPGGTMVTLGVDNPLGDVNGDGNPEIAMGRLPAQTPAALTAMVNRIVQHESSDAWKSKLLLVADRDTNDIFKQACDRIAEHIPAGMVTGRLNHTASTPVETMRTNFIQGLNAGYALAVYVGHANNIGMSSPYFFEYSSSRSYMPNLTNTVRTPLLLAGTCMLNDFAQAHPTSRCIGKGFLDTAPGGAVAVWASAAASTLYSSEGTSSAILDKLFERHAGRLGDLIRPGLDFEAQSITPWVVRASVLLGDPGTRIRTHLYTPVTLHPSTVSVPATASAGHVFSVTSDVAWTAAPGAAWITVTGGATGSGDGPVTFSVAENIGPARTGSVLVAGGGMVRTGRVQQAAAQVTLTLAVEPVLGGSALGAGTYAVGQTAEITGAANSNWKFIRWSDGNTQNPRLLAVPVGGADLTAHFEPSAGMWPSGDMVVVNRRPQFFWQATSGATWYLVWIVRNGQKYMEQWVQEVTTWTPPSDLPSGQYQWWIRPWGPTIGTGAWSAEARFSIPLKLPGVLVQLAPTGVQATHNLTYRWQKDANATWYRLWVTRVGAGTWHDRWIEMSGTGEGAFQPGGAHPGPAKPVLSEPAGTLATNRPTFRWAGGACEWWLTSWAPDGNGPWSGPMAFHIPYPSGTWSRVFVNRGTTLALDQWTTNSNLVSPILLIRGNYSWWLGVWDSKSSQTIWSDRMDFTIP